MSEIEDARTAGTYVVSLDDTRATNRALVGGKGANLAQLVEADLPVPAGFCVTTAAYEELIDDPAIKEAIDKLAGLDPSDTAAISDAGSALRARIQNRSVSEEIRDTIETALNEIASDPEQTYAVRSSATAEDLPEASFAGQQETFLNVRGADEIIARVRACMASLFTDRAIAYRARNDVAHEEVSIAVVVQQMVIPDISGILFTADPQTGNRHIASIEAGMGLGEALVSGEVTADNIRVDTRTDEVLDYEVGDQQSAVRPIPEGGTETVKLNTTERSSRVLTVEQIQTLVELGEEIEALLESPQDIEWCLKGEEFYVVQSRPITSLFPLPSPLPDDDRLHVYFSLGHVQAFAEAMPPLVRDVWIEFCNLWMVELGMDTTAQWAVEAGGRVYIDMTPFLKIGFVRRGFPKWLSATSEPLGIAVDDLLARRGDEFQEKWTARKILSLVNQVTSAVRTQARPMISAVVSGFFGAFIGEPTPKREEARWNTWGWNAAAPVRTPETPAERARAVFDSDNSALTNYPRLGPLYAAQVADGLLQQLFPDSPEELNDVGRGFPDELVTRINLGLGDLADVARDHPAVAHALREGTSLDEIESLEGGEAFRAALDDFLEEFGHRATGELDISRPRWRDEPSGLLATVRANVKHEQAGEHREHLRQMEKQASAAARYLEERADCGVFGPLCKRVVRRLIRTYRGYIQTREHPKHGLAHLFAAWHEAIRDAGELLVDEGQLDEINDVWFLRREELFAALEGNLPEIDIASRRAEFERHKTVDAPPVLTSEGEAPSSRIEREDVPEGALVGTGVSGGVVEGVARVVRDPSEETIEKGEILIAPSSDPGWTPLFLNAAGMVVEVGGQMSHGALVAREYGLPAVVSVSEATRRIKTGQRVRIDGTQGIVEILDDDE
ncbi:PEP/pyruvate-binding domain-containing protein [Haladaptatus pallidirubidus]|uniref:Probable phosphoenolpyruvate synthase n=1 Tax=Haladaptatus pallidirubidus TaxID=1008152 RepID=A0AAV3URT4_9EURY|nr:PEP/pyruvate-binding domain-containing protein [Haladaptatus pallidirubidus]